MNDVNNIIINKLAYEIGVLKTRVIQVETYNEILVEQNKQLQAQLEELKGEEKGESEEEGD